MEDASIGKISGRGGIEKLCVPKTLRFQNRENAAICNRRRKKRCDFLLKIWAPESGFSFLPETGKQFWHHQ